MITRKRGLKHELAKTKQVFEDSTMRKHIPPIDRYTLFETVSYLYWKICKFYKNKGYNRWESGKIAKALCMKRFGYENYQNWRHRFQDEHYSDLYYQLKTQGYDRR
jgi:hypothetical protein